MMLAYMAALSASGTCAAIALPFPPLPFFQQKRSPKRRSVWWNCPAQQTACFKEYKPGEMELGVALSSEKGAGESLGS